MLHHTFTNVINHRKLIKRSVFVFLHNKCPFQFNKMKNSGRGVELRPKCIRIKTYMYIYLVTALYKLFIDTFTLNEIEIYIYILVETNYHYSRKVT